MKAAPFHTGIYIVADQACARRRLDHQRRVLRRALDVMRRGASLNLTYRPAGERWALSDGTTVPPDVAAILIAHPNVVAVGDTLLPNTRSQTWRYLGSHKGD